MPSAVIAPRRATVAGARSLRLTRRGRVVVGVVAIVVMAAVALIVALAAAGGAEAANHGQPQAVVYQGMHKVVVQAGQTLWSIASRAEPGADPRAVVQQIMTTNALTSTNISPGQVLWVPR